MKHVIPTVTLDTNVLVEFWRSQNRATVTESLLNLAESSQVDLAITSRINADIPLPPLANRINELPELKVQQVGAVFRLDHSALDGGDMLGSGEFLSVMELVEDQLGPAAQEQKTPGLEGLGPSPWTLSHWQGSIPYLGRSDSRSCSGTEGEIRCYCDETRRIPRPTDQSNE